MIITMNQNNIFGLEMRSMTSLLAGSSRFAFSQSPSKTPFLRISPTALERLKQIMQQRKGENLVGVKISLTKKGCNGLAYSMDYVQADQIKKFDEVVEDQGVKVIIDSKALMALVGTEMNFVEDELGSQFVFNNPNEKGRCGCGTSFHL